MEPILNYVLFVANLNANLFSVSQFYDDNLMVMLTKNSFQVLKNDGNTVLRGARFRDNCYLLESDITCHASKANCTDLWHEWLRQINYTDLVRLTKLNAIRDVSKLTKKV